MTIVKGLVPFFTEKSQQYKAWFFSLNAKDKLALQFLSLFLCALVLYLGLWQPGKNYRIQAAQQYSSQLELYQWMLANESLARQVQGFPDDNITTSVDSSSILAIVDSTAKLHNIILQRYEPSRENGVRIWLEKTSFNDLVIWIEELGTVNNISIQELSIEKEPNEGLVSARIEFMKIPPRNL